MPSSLTEDLVIDVGRTGGVLAVGSEPPERSDVALRARGSIEAERRNLLLQVPMPTALLTGPQHVFELANSLYREMIGNRDVVGKTWAQVFPELVDSAYPAILDRVYQSGESFVSPESLVSLDRNGDREPEDCFFRFSLHPLRDAEAHVYGMIAAAVDITEQVSTRRALEIALSDRERLLRKWRQVASDCRPKWSLRSGGQARKACVLKVSTTQTLRVRSLCGNFEKPEAPELRRTVRATNMGNLSWQNVRR